jgi:hypothetical protein
MKQDGKCVFPVARRIRKSENLTVFQESACHICGSPPWCQRNGFHKRVEEIQVSELLPAPVFTHAGFGKGEQDPSNLPAWFHNPAPFALFDDIEGSGLIFE